MSNVSKCFSCVRKNDYDPKFGYYGCKFSGHECKDYSMFEPKVKQKPITNADRIRAMKDEELAELFEMIPHSGNPQTYTTDGFCIDDGLKTKKQWLDWLKQEAEG